MHLTQGINMRIMDLLKTKKLRTKVITRHKDTQSAAFQHVKM